MRIDKLYIQDFKNLKDFSIDFDEGALVTVLLGWNGTGKSNLIEALVIIFRDLDLGNSPSFPYEINYMCRQYTVEINAKSTDRKDIEITVNDERVSYSQFTSEKGKKYRPAHVFGYYSGPSNRLEKHFNRHQERFYRDLLENKPEPLRPLFYARPVHSQFVLLSFFRDKKAQRQKFLKEFLGIEKLESVLFVMREPPWKQTKPSKDMQQKGDPRFWLARGAVKDFLTRLYDVALAPMRLDHRVPLEFQKSKNMEHVYLYIKDNVTLEKLARFYKDKTELFKTLESTYISKLLAEVRIKVKIRNLDGALTFRELSEGEQQLITVLGLLEFTKEEESLFLLDEPDTHLNPNWSMQYLHLLQAIIDKNDNSHIIMATHDPLVISGLKKSEVQVLTRNTKDSRILALSPTEDPQGMGVEGILKSEMFGLRATIDQETLQKVDERAQLYAKGDERNQKENQRLQELSTELAALGFGWEFRDPHYSLFMKALARRPEYQKPILTPEEIKKQEKIADEVLDEILGKKK